MSTTLSTTSSRPERAVIYSKIELELLADLGQIPIAWVSDAQPHDVFAVGG